VAILEIDKKITRKERFQIWWKSGGNIQCAIALVALIILVSYRDNALVVGITACFIALWGFGKLFFKKEHRYLVFIMSTWILYKGIVEILSYYRG
jgi:hypothetical protein